MEYHLKERLTLLEKYHKKYIIDGEPMPPKHDVINPDVYESWKRSKAHRVNPNVIATYKLPDHEFQQVLKENELLINSAIPYIESIYNFVKGTNFVIHLTDKNGCLLKYYADDTQINNLFKETSMLREGSIRNELISGTDSTSLCMAINKPTQVIGAEHYLIGNHAFFCSSAPIHDTEENLLGVLTVMGPKELHQDHTLGMACATANGIELALQKQQYYQKLTATNNLLDAAIREMATGFVTIDENKKIVHYNERFIEMLKLPLNDYRGKDIFSILNQSSFPKEIRNLDSEAEDISFTLTTVYGDSSRILLLVKPVAIHGDNSSITMLAFKEERQFHTLVKKMSNLRATFTFNSIIGNSRAITEVKMLGMNAANSTSNVLILGDSGTGKELLAQSIHNASERKDMPFVTINCGSIPKNLIESELFGYESGAFTGAKQEGHPGKFELADKGTLFLDEIGDMPLELQASLLRVLQSHEIVRIGGKFPKYVDVRIVAATNVDLIEAVNNKTFRSDLYYRLNVLNILLPSLKERKDDIPILVNKFIEVYSKSLKKGSCTISNEALYLLSQYDWPGNIRELENVIERAINIIPGTQITEEHLPHYIAHPKAVAPSVKPHEYFLSEIFQPQDHATEEPISPAIRERAEIIGLLKQEKGHVSSVAQRMSIPVSTLYRKLKKYNINAKEFKSW